MRLLNTASLELSCLFVPSDVPDYVILSHRWSAEEVTFADITKAPISKSQSETRAKSGFAKIQGVCELASKDGYEWIWIDTCCIDKSSSAELQEAINSMWRYYEEANICYVYMADVPDAEAGWGHRFTESEWFTRGWTLQELIAPVCLEFYAGNWEPIGTKFERYRQIADITSINVGVLIRIQAIDLFSTAEKFSWASHRIVTREEDEAYSLLGIFDVNMPLLYGEGREKAFVRLQEAIYNSTADDSIFLFRHSLHDGSQPLLADSPRRFCDRKNCISCLSQGTHCLPPNFRYGDIIASERWSTQAHEQIMTTVTTVRNEMSTVLSLLTYRDICHKLEYLDNETPPSNVTDVAILNQTLEKYPQGALCLLLRRWPEQDGCLRLGAYPTILPHVKDFVSRLRKEKLLVCPDPKFPGSNDRINTIFSVESSLFRVETWSARGDTSHSTLSSQAGQRSDFEIQMGKTEGSKDSIQISCRVAHLQDPSQTFTIQLARVSEIWSIEEVFKRKQGTRDGKLSTLFLSFAPADRCSVRFPDGKGMSVKLRRLPGTSRVHQGDYFLTMRYRISIDYNDN